LRSALGSAGQSHTRLLEGHRWAGKIPVGLPLLQIGLGKCPIAAAGHLICTEVQAEFPAPVHNVIHSIQQRGAFTGALSVAACNGLAEEGASYA